VRADIVGLACVLIGCGSGGHSKAGAADAATTPPFDASTVDGAEATDAHATDSSTTQPGRTIYAFSGASSPSHDGAEPKGTLTAVTASDGSTVLYGRTAIGGTNGCGIIFSIDPDGSSYEVLYRFGGSDGCDPRHDAMTLNPNDGKLYGTTQGVNQTLSGTNTYGNWGQIFSFLPGAPIPTPIHAVHTFADPSPTVAPFDGAEQHSSFSIDPTSGALYGQSAAGGANDHGMLYSVQPDGATFTDLYDFAKSDGDDPHGRIVLVSGVLYGIARKGGSSDLGAVYAYRLTGSHFTVLHTFAGGHGDGASSDHGYLTPVTLGGETTLFGMTQCGGAGTGQDACSHSDGGGDGVIFQINPTPDGSATFSIVHSFQGTEKNDGAGPYGSLLYDGTYLYGTTSAGGAYDKGTVFRFTPPSFGGTVTPTVLYEFGTKTDDGIKPIDDVIKLGDTLYGMTVYGGASGPSPDDVGVHGSGAIFALPLDP
jgi:uncharacterized repeat protein (TIGR03803 family)